jgi:hypothetical protein
MTGASIDRRYYELCALSELKEECSPFRRHLGEGPTPVQKLQRLRCLRHECGANRIESYMVATMDLGAARQLVEASILRCQIKDSAHRFFHVDAGTPVSSYHSSEFF